MKDRYIADIRSGCCAVYLKSRKGDTNGCHQYDDRNIWFSSDGAKYVEGPDGGHWTLPRRTIRACRKAARQANRPWSKWQEAQG
jgi:hypothetical protein